MAAQNTLGIEFLTAYHHHQVQKLSLLTPLVYRPISIIMKLSLSLLAAVAAVSVSTSSADDCQFGAKADGSGCCQEFDSQCTGEYDVPIGPEIQCPADAAAGMGCKTEGLICKVTDFTQVTCQGGTFVGGDLNPSPTADPVFAPTPRPSCDGTAAGCSGPVNILSKDAEEDEVGAMAVDSAGGASPTGIAAAIAAAGIAALL